MYRIITSGLYISYPIIENHFFVFKDVFSENVVLMYDWYSKAVSNQERVIKVEILKNTYRMRAIITRS